MSRPVSPLLRVGVAADRGSRGILARQLRRRPRGALRRWLALIGALGLGFALGYAVATRELEAAVFGAEDAARAFLFLQVLKASPSVALEVCITDAECETAGYLAGI